MLLFNQNPSVSRVTPTNTATPHKRFSTRAIPPAASALYTLAPDDQAG
jgi:hypothetical protein